jgi:hypothetical protein
MNANDMIVGERYRIKYRKFDPTGRPVHSKLIDGEGTLVSKYSVNMYNHIFALDNNEQVWVTSNSVFELENQKLIGVMLDNTEFDLGGVEEVSVFLNGIGVKNQILGSSIVIDFSGVSIMKQLLSKMYATLLLDDDL